MKVLHIAPIGHHAEGIGTVLNKLVTTQVSLGEDVRIVSPFKNNTYNNLPITTITKINEFKRFLDVWVPDIVVFHSVFNLNYIKFYNILNKRNIPYLIQLHGALSIENFNKNNFKKRVALTLWIKRFIQHAKSIIYLNDSEYKNSIVPKIKPEYAIIPNGCDSHEDINMLGNIDSTLRIIYIGRIVYLSKGLDILLDALRKLEIDEATGYKVTFYGNEDDIDVGRLKKDIEGMENVSYGGGVYGEKKDHVLRKSDIFILTSRYEGMPMGVLEAWSYGLPCIITPGTNMVNEHSDTDYYWYTELNAASIEATIKRAIQQYRLNAPRYRAASIYQSKKYEWTQIAKSSIELYLRFKASEKDKVKL